MNLTKKKVINYLSEFDLKSDCEDCPLGWINFRNIANLKEITQNSGCCERVEHLIGIKCSDSSCTTNMDLLKKFFDKNRCLRTKFLDNE